jgi:hypothetical protein
VVALKSFEMSFDALHDLSIRNLVAPELASNVPIAIDGLVVGSIIATASFRKQSMGWWYATALFALSTLVSVSGNIQYAHEIGGGVVSMVIYAGMPVTMLFAVHLTLMLSERGRQVAGEKAAEIASAADEARKSERTTEPITVGKLEVQPLEAVASGLAGRPTIVVGSRHRSTSLEAIERPKVAATAVQN